MRLAPLALVGLATSATADQVPAPDYFVASAFETSTAQVIALSCSTLAIDPAAIARHTEEVLLALEADGFTSENLVDRMADPSDAVGALQSAFLARHDLADGAPEAAVCAAGEQEIAEQTALGGLLMEVTP